MRDCCDVVAVGRVATNPDGGITKGGEPVTSFRFLAGTPRGAFTPLYTVRAFGPLALQAGHLEVGRRVRVAGALLVSPWTGRDGIEHISLSIRASTIEALDDTDR